LNSLKVIFDIVGKEKRLEEIETLIAQKGFWDNPEETTGVLKERTSISGVLDRFKTLYSDLEECEILLELGIEESDTDTVEEASEQLQNIERRLNKLSIDLTLSGEDDPNNSIVSINAGAGGTEAQDWAEMLFRMYTRWIDRKGFKIHIIDDFTVQCRWQETHIFCLCVCLS